MVRLVWKPSENAIPGVEFKPQRERLICLNKSGISQALRVVVMESFNGKGKLKQHSNLTILRWGVPQLINQALIYVVCRWSTIIWYGKCILCVVVWELIGGSNCDSKSGVDVADNRRSINALINIIKCHPAWEELRSNISSILPHLFYTSNTIY